MEQANITRFIEFVNEKYALEIGSYDELYRWTIDQISDFWESMWEYGEILSSHKYNMVVDDLHQFPGARWFEGAKLNFAENLLRYKDNRVAIIFRGENQTVSRTSFFELRESVARLVESLQNLGIRSEDRIAAYMPNLKETTIALLTATSIGATWASCGVELGPTAVLERLNQIEPKVLFTVSGYSYKGNHYDVLPKIEQISKHLSSLEKVIVFPHMKENPDISSLPKAVLYDDFISQGRPREIPFTQLPFEHPLYIMFSSGTTGKPKCMVQGAGGVLINHLKELILHTDLKPEDRIMYLTSPSWMMWNWLLSSLAVGATVVLSDGNPNYPDWSELWRFIQDERITIFGCSATHINFLRHVGAKPSQCFDLSALREISQTGSALSAEGFKYVYRDIKEDIHFNSISGGTDINGCFALGSPIQPVYAGELQGPALGMKVCSYDDVGRSVVDQP
jgi:acetoacetyl-CoA synthetase